MYYFAASLGGTSDVVLLLGILALMLLASRVSSLFERFNQPKVLGEILTGIFLSALGYAGLTVFEEVKSSDIIAFLAQLGALLLMLSIGLEASVRGLRKVASRALAVAGTGIAIPLLAGSLLVAPLLLSDGDYKSYLFFGAIFVATSISISVAVFQPLGLLKTALGYTVLGAALIDDIIGVLLLAVITQLATTESVTIPALILVIAKALGFVGIALVAGRYITNRFAQIFAAINRSIETKFITVIAIMLLLAFMAESLGMSAIVGAFAAGLLLQGINHDDYENPEIVEDLQRLDRAEHHKNRQLAGLIAKYKTRHIEQMVGSLGSIFIPVFFIFIGLQINIEALLRMDVYMWGIVVGVIAIATKLAAGFAYKGNLHDKLLVGAAMVPRGEVGLIFAGSGLALGVFNDRIYAIALIAILITTFIAPPLMSRFHKPTRVAA